MLHPRIKLQVQLNYKNIFKTLLPNKLKLYVYFFKFSETIQNLGATLPKL